MEVNTMGRYTTRSLDRDSYEKLVKTIRCGYEYNGVKHRPNYQIAAILVLEGNLGCRIGDIIALTTDSIVNDGGIWKLNIEEEKTGKKRYFIVPQQVKAFIDEYCRVNGITEGKLFTIKADAVWKQLQAATRYLDYKYTSTHSLRKMAAQAIYENTNHDIEAVSEFLNHSSINTTRHYIKRSDEQLESAIMSAVCIV
jgi:integrase